MLAKGVLGSHWLLLLGIPEQAMAVLGFLLNLVPLSKLSKPRFTLLATENKHVCHGSLYTYHIISLKDKMPFLPLNSCQLLPQWIIRFVLGFQGPYHKHRSTFITAWFSNYIHFKVKDEIPKRQRCSRWSLAMKKLLHPALDRAYDYSSILGLKLNHVS